MFERRDFQLSRRFPAWQRCLMTLAGLFAGYLVYGASLFVVGVAHMHPKLPAHYFAASLSLQVFPLLISALAWLLFLWSHRKKWLLLTVAAWGWVAISIPVLSAWIRSQV